MLRKFALLLAAGVLCQCKADDARAPASETPTPQGAPALPAAAPAQEQQPAAEPSDGELETERPGTGAAAPAKGKPVSPSPPKDSKTRGLDGLDPVQTGSDKAFTSLSEAEAALSSADQQLTRLYVVSGKASQLAEDDDRCVRACGAFSSLERAAAGVCRLAGEADARCAKARGRVNHHKSKIAACSCGDD